MKMTEAITLPAPKRVILSFGGIVWAIAGANIVIIGFPRMMTGLHQSLFFVFVLGAAVVFGLFFFLIFMPLYRKHSRRIITRDRERASVFTAFDVKGYLIMAFMMTLGITLRSLSVIPPLYLGSFYVGLGSALFLTGVFFLSAAFRFDTLAQDYGVETVDIRRTSAG